MANPIVHPDFNPFRGQNARARQLREFTKALEPVIDEYESAMDNARSEDEKARLDAELRAAIDKLEIQFGVACNSDSRNLY